MKYQISFIKSIFVFSALLLFVEVGAQTNRSSTQQGNWGAMSTWGNQSVPTSTTIVNIAHTVTIENGQSRTAQTVNINSGGILQKENGNGIATLTVTTINLNTGGLIRRNSGAGTFVTVATNLNVYGGTLDVDGQNLNITGTLTINSGTVTIRSNQIVNGNVILNGGTLNLIGGTINGTVTNNGGTISGSGTTVSGGIITPPPPSPDLIIDSDITLNEELSIPNSITITGNGKVRTQNNRIRANTVNVNGRLRVSNPGGLFGPNGVFDTTVTNVVFGPNSEIIYDATSGTQIITARNYRKLSIENNANRVLQGNVTIENELNMQGNGKLDIGNHTLSLNGSFVGNANAALRGGPNAQLIIDGNGDFGTLYLDNTNPGQTNKLRRLTINRANQSVTLGNRVEVDEDVIVNNGTLNSNGNLVLVSNATKTARVAAGHNRINGRVVAQRHIPEVARRWRFIGSPVQDDTIGGLRRSIFVTGPGGVANGFDASYNNAHTVFSYNESTPGNVNQGWVGPANTAEVMPVGRGYRVFVRGDRSNIQRMSNTNLPQNEVTLELVGPLNSGNITMPVSFTSTATMDDDGWSLLANPYASAFDWNAFWNSPTTTKTNLLPTIWVFNSQSNNYVSYNAQAQSGTLTNGIIPQGAAFWVKATAANPQLILSDAFTTSATPIQVFKNVANSSFGIRLQSDSINFDEVTVKYIQGATDTLDQYDITKMYSGISLATWGADNRMLSHSSLALKPTVNDTIRLAVSGGVGAYTLTFDNSHTITIHDQVFLVDNFTSQMINLLTTPTYSFNITSNTASLGLNRFYIVMANNATVPVDLMHFGAVLGEDKQVRINWTTASEINTSHFEVERSADGKLFNALNRVGAAGSKGILTSYTSIDERPQAINYYRLKMVDHDGTFKYSQTRIIKLEEQVASNAVALYPVPVVEQLTIAHKQTGIKEVKLYGMWGQLFSTQRIDNQQATQLDMSKYGAGMYIVEVTDENGQITREQIVKE